MFVCGTAGSGKSYLAARWAELCTRVIIFDTLGTFQAKGFNVVTTPQGLFELLKSGERFKVLYRPTQGSREEHFIRVCQLAKARRGVTLVVDEVDAYTTSREMPDALYELVHYGRHHRVALVMTARRVTDVPRGLTSQCTEIISFVQHEPRDLKEWESRAGADFARRLPVLQKYRYAGWKPTGEIYEVQSGR